MVTMIPESRQRVWNLPNQLTASRFVLALILFVLIAAELWLWCLIVFVVAAFTDWLDGYLARRQNLTSTLGRILDPLVDKVLMCGVYICLLPFGEGKWLWPWMVTVVVARELVITGLRSWLESHGARFGADWLGKFKMGLQCAAVIAVFVAFLVPPDSGSLNIFFDSVRNILIWSMVAATLLSGLQYVWKAVTLLNV
ncbi:MAG TPA: CDP-diacylglycerol--glycerol-3-phosphate 3-phosphatidyltransferase [Gemmataceae bacterium]|nr:CDP-diacylglycerol--glycerol-3-phosphate 3-phosphatidyltransferase [Gemmataceae bacterium]